MEGPWASASGSVVQGRVQEPGSWGKTTQLAGAKAMPHTGDSPAQKRQRSGTGKTSLPWDPLSTACLEKS